ncbi:succinate dehydrogenase assembly factor 2 [Comamonas flocculans]|uniref:FAD assembly factor SdhE n=1 Tax=Comamonas flocculans TaxID=2597701 RepID=A0A5B8RSF0_9BURK|nr:succinate dehydrogenase assembly factor 2 [Comamonas flocculans]QEA11632.1 succinate dehydrogenase assembly factor 2 [Comamonas flocculans]
MPPPDLLDERETSILRWRCRRGLLENDIFIERFFQVHGQRVSEEQAYGLTLLMNLPDNDLLELFLRRTEPADELDVPQVHAVLELIRQRPPGGLPS